MFSNKTLCDQPRTHLIFTPLAFTEKPHFDKNLPTRIRAETGGNVSIPCRAAGTPAPAVLWARNASGVVKPLAPAAFANPTGELRLVGLKAEHAGTYLCLAENKLGTATRNISLELGKDLLGRSLVLCRSRKPLQMQQHFWKENTLLWPISLFF